MTVALRWRGYRMMLEDSDAVAFGNIFLKRYGETASRDGMLQSFNIDILHLPFNLSVAGLSILRRPSFFSSMKELGIA